MAGKCVLFIARAQAVTGLFAGFKEAGLEFGIADSLDGALSYVKKSSPCLVFSQAKIGSFQAQALLAAAKELPGFPPIIIFSEQGSAAEARNLLELGAKDYWLEPLVFEKVKAVLDLEAAPRPQKPAPLQAPAPSEPNRFAIIGKHPAILRVLALAKQVARSKATVLISGESGTGKEMFARFLHLNSDRANAPFVALNCAALPEHLLESELFGHEKGAFTGAIGRKLGKFELASSGTILLDEISEMELGLQAKLLRVLQEGEFDRVGGVEPVKVDVRVLATTNRKLEQSVEEGKFRQDLYYRLNVIPLKLPALRERGEDVLVLAEYFVDKFCRMYGLGKLAFAADARAWILEYAWPGNVRELQNLMERAVLLAGSGPISKAHFLLDPDAWPLGDGTVLPSEEPLLAESSQPCATPVAEQGALQAAMPQGVVPLDVLERHMILKSLDETSGNRTQAANLLGISVRTLRNKLAEYREQGLDIP